MNTTDKHTELKAILDEALQEFPEVHLPAEFTDRLLTKLESRLAWRELLAEFGLKTGLVIGAFLVLAAVVFFPGKKSDLSMISYLAGHWQIIAALTAVFFFTFFFDQVFLRLLFRRNRP
jgi:hypothetical protein